MQGTNKRSTDCVLQGFQTWLLFFPVLGIGKTTKMNMNTKNIVCLWSFGTDLLLFHTFTASWRRILRSAEYPPNLNLVTSLHTSTCTAAHTLSPGDPDAFPFFIKMYKRNQKQVTQEIPEASSMDF